MGHRSSTAYQNNCLLNYPCFPTNFRELVDAPQQTIRLATSQHLEDGAQPEKFCGTATCAVHKKQFPSFRAFNLVPFMTTKKKRQKKMRDGISHVLSTSFLSPCLQQLLAKYF